MEDLSLQEFEYFKRYHRRQTVQLYGINAYKQLKPTKRRAFTMVHVPRSEGRFARLSELREAAKACRGIKSRWGFRELPCGRKAIRVTWKGGSRTIPLFERVGTERMQGRAGA